MKTELLLLTLAIVLFSQLAFSQPEPTIYVEAYPDLSILVKHFVPAEPPSLVEVEVLGTPQYLIVTNDLDEPLVYNLTGRELVALLIEGNAVKIDYVVENFINETGISYQLNLNGLEDWNTVVVKLPPQTVVLGVEPTPSSIRTEDSSLVLEFEKPVFVYIEYMYEIAEDEKPIPAKEEKNIDEKLCALGAISAILVVIAIIYFRKTGVVLTEEEEEILKFVKSRKGRAYLKEIREALELPASTAWRRVKRMEKMGVVKLYKTPHGILVVAKR